MCERVIVVLVSASLLLVGLLKGWTNIATCSAGSYCAITHKT